MHSKHVIAKYARLELHRPPSAWRLFARNVAIALGQFVVAVVAGAAFGFLVSL